MLRNARAVLLGLGHSVVACMMMTAASTARAEAVVYRIDRDVTHVEYVARALGIIEAHGRFNDVRGTIVLDPLAAEGDVDFEIDARSADSGWDLRDAFVRGEPMLDAERHPMIRFRSTRLVFRDARLIGIEGMLTLRGVTRRVTLTVADLVCAPIDCVAHAAATIRRGAFGMDAFSHFVGDDVELQFVVVAHRVQETITER